VTTSDGDLFSPADAAMTVPAQDGGTRVPLSTRMRPRTLDEVVGQESVIGEGTVRAIDAGQPPSLIFYGPPGTGKTTLATLIAQRSTSSFEQISAVNTGVADIRKVVERARERQRVERRTVLFIDEIHRFNKSQQDAILPHVESGLIHLLGATTENPGFEVNAALLSRSRVVRLAHLDAAALGVVIDRALGDAERGLPGVTLAEAGRQALIAGCGGDARIALNALEVAAASAGEASVAREDVVGALASTTLLYDKGGDQHYWLVSALIKSTRDSDSDAAVYWLARMLEAGEDPMFLARRLVLLAAEDVGLADPHALPLAVAAMQATHAIGMPEAYLPLAECVLYLASVPKRNSVYRAYAAARSDVEATLHQSVPLHLRNAATSLGRSMGFGSDYEYVHDDPEGITAQEHLPDELRGHRYFEPMTAGAEARIAQRVADLRARVAERRR